MRKQLIKNIVEKYIRDYTCATMSDIYVEMRHEQAVADAYLWGKIIELAIKPNELAEAYNAVSAERVAQNKPVIYNESVMAWGKGA